MRFKIDWASLIVKSKFIVQPGGLYLEGRFSGGFFALPVWEAPIWRGLFSEFYGMFIKRKHCVYKWHAYL